MLNRKLFLTSLFLVLSITCTTWASDEMPQITVQTPDGSTTHTSLEIANRFAKLRDLLETPDPKNPNLIELVYSDFTAQDLKILFGMIIQNLTNLQIRTNLMHKDFKTLVSMLLAIDQLGLEISSTAERKRIAELTPNTRTPAEQAILQNWQITQLLISKIKKMATPALVETLPNHVIQLSRLLLDIKEPEINNVIALFLRPDGQQLITISDNLTARLYHKNCVPLSTAPFATNIDDIEWQPNSVHFLARDRDTNLYLYNTNGQKLNDEPITTNVDKIHWQPNSQSFLILDHATNLFLYNQNGTKAIPNPIASRIFSVYWNPNNKQFLTINLDHEISIYNADGTPANLDITADDIDMIYWNPTGGHFLAINSDDELFIYNADGTPATPGPIANDIENISWAPNGQKFLATDSDHNLFIYNNDGTKSIIDPIANNINEMYWRPNGQQFLTLGFNKRLFIYNNEGNQLSKNPIAIGTRNIIWQNHGLAYYVTLTNGVTKLIRLNNVSIHDLDLKQQLLVQAIINQFKETHRPAILEPTKFDILPTKVINQLIFYGFLTHDSTISAGAGIEAGTPTNDTGAANGNSAMDTEMDNNTGVDESKG